MIVDKYKLGFSILKVIWHERISVIFKNIGRHSLYFSLGPNRSLRVPYGLAIYSHRLDAELYLH